MKLNEMKQSNGITKGVAAEYAVVVAAEYTVVAEGKFEDVKNMPTIA